MADVNYWCISNDCKIPTNKIMMPDASTDMLCHLSFKKFPQC